MSALVLFTGVLALAAPDGFGSADGKVRAKTPVARPIKRSGPQKETLERKAKEDERRALVISSLELAEGAKIPEGADYAELIERVLKASKVLRLVYAKDCFELECMRKAAAVEQTPHLVFASMSGDRRITLLLNELPGRGLLRQRTTPPLEASDLFETELTTALTDLLGLGSESEGTFEPDAKSAPEPVAGENAAAWAKRRQKINHSTYAVYAGAGLFGLGMTVGTLAAINASQWRNTSYRFEDGAYREQIRGIAQTRAVIADVLLFTGALASGAGYYVQRKAVAGPFGKMTIGWGQDTWREPEPVAAPETTDPGANDPPAKEGINSAGPDFIEPESNEGAQP